MIGRAGMEALGWWEKLHASRRDYLQMMWGGQVVFVERQFSAVIHPRDETVTATEITVID
ncbi:hypothetical protein [Sphingomonas xinjiangensis]|uniref:Uncharacterized protein n=1 Tax=Sphingomonas xinjiangensis TaxID=643568 RepID=A0A840YBK3_9SPHN|nr:hypothetical protein [Sphingomonas xinjiangensis]MBB5709675.1 hypothetical protein [Sphingomonas xinjiangensis]